MRHVDEANRLMVENWVPGSQDCHTLPLGEGGDFALGPWQPEKAGLYLQRIQCNLPKRLLSKIGQEFTMRSGEQTFCGVERCGVSFSQPCTQPVDQTVSFSGIS